MSDRSDIRSLKAIMLAIWSSGPRRSPIKWIILKSFSINQGALAHFTTDRISFQNLGRSVLAQGPYTEETTSIVLVPCKIA